ncbi:hypothetical protein PM082_015593 [Marasmius tenuissimus]|nr:hypothetical protein PM082_015593 [Marasmius tenuissimus]
MGNDTNHGLVIAVGDVIGNVFIYEDSHPSDEGLGEDKDSSTHRWKLERDSEHGRHVAVKSKCLSRPFKKDPESRKVRSLPFQPTTSISLPIMASSSSSSSLSVITLTIMMMKTILSAVAFPSHGALPRKRATSDNMVSLASRDSYCMIMPRTLHTDIGDSEHPGGMTTYCSKNARFADTQGTIPDGFWIAVDFQMGVSDRTGGRFAQMTGCINPGVLDRLNPGDGGGQYDSSGGRGGRGNPRDSVCDGYQHYVQLLEPAASRACIKCCDNLDDCPTKMDRAGCVAVIPGNYFDCA